MANSKLATYRNPTRNHSGVRTKHITKITPHEMAAIWSGKQCADYFESCGRTGRQASSNYCVGNGGDIAVSVDEANRAWTSSSESNDQAAVTIEVSNSACGGDWPVSPAAYQALVKLCADICKRNGINPAYNGGPSGTITMHKMFAATACPGPYLSHKITSGELARDIKAAMGQGTSKPVSQQLYRIRKSWADVKSQIGAYKSLENAKKACGKGYTVYDKDGKAVYTPSGSGAKKWTQDCVLKVGDKVISVSCGLKEIAGTGTAYTVVDGVECVNVPALGGPVPLSDISEAPDSKDGNPKDNYLASTLSRAFLLQATVTEIISNDMVRIDRGYPVKTGPLMALR